MDNLPRWIKQEDQCIWCRRPAPIYSVFVNDKGLLEAWYECSYDECGHMKRHNKPNNFGFVWSNKKAVEVYKRKQNAKPQKDQASA